MIHQLAQRSPIGTFRWWDLGRWKARPDDRPPRYRLVHRAIPTVRGVLSRVAKGVGAVASILALAQLIGPHRIATYYVSSIAKSDPGQAEIAQQGLSRIHRALIAIATAVGGQLMAYLLLGVLVTGLMALSTFVTTIWHYPPAKSRPGHTLTWHRHMAWHRHGTALVWGATTIAILLLISDVEQPGQISLRSLATAFLTVNVIGALWALCTPWGYFQIMRIFFAATGRLPWRLMRFLDTATAAGVLSELNCGHAPAPVAALAQESAAQDRLLPAMNRYTTDCARVLAAALAAKPKGQRVTTGQVMAAVIAANVNGQWDGIWPYDPWAEQLLHAPDQEDAYYWIWNEHELTMAVHDAIVQADDLSIKDGVLISTRTLALAMLQARGSGAATVLTLFNEINLNELVLRAHKSLE